MAPLTVPKQPEEAACRSVIPKCLLISSDVPKTHCTRCWGGGSDRTDSEPRGGLGAGETKDGEKAKAVPFHPDCGWELRRGESRKGAHLVVQFVQFFRNRTQFPCVCCSGSMPGSAQPRPAMARGWQRVVGSQPFRVHAGLPPVPFRPGSPFAITLEGPLSFWFSHT